MTQILNLDKLETRKDKVVILNGKEHIMKTLTVKDYIEQMKSASKIDTLTKDVDMNSANEILDITIEALSKCFPTIQREEFEALTFEQLTAMRELTEKISDDDVEDLKEPEKGEVEGEQAEK